MRIFYDFDLFDNPEIDGRLIEILLTIKNTLLKEIKDIKN